MEVYGGIYVKLYALLGRSYISIRNAALLTLRLERMSELLFT
jgi:hypothetical protein